MRTAVVPEHLTAADRFELLAELERLADAANEVGVILGRIDGDRPALAAAQIAVDGARQLAAAAWVLQGPVRKFIVGGLATANGHRDR